MLGQERNGKKREEKKGERNMGLLTKRVTAAQLRFLRILGRQLVTNAVEQLHVALLRVLLERGDERPGHGAGGLTADGSVCASLHVLAARPHDDIRGAGTGLSSLFETLVATGSLLEEVDGAAHHATHIAASVGRDDSQKTLTSLLGKIGFLEDTLGRIDEW